MTEPAKHFTAEDLQEDITTIATYAAIAGDTIASLATGDITASDLTEYAAASDALTELVARYTKVVLADPDTSPAVALLYILANAERDVAAEGRDREADVEQWVSNVLEAIQERNK